MKTRLLAVLKAFLWGLVVIVFPVLSGVICTVASLSAVATLFVQGGFMCLALVLVAVMLLCRKWKANEIGFAAFNKPVIKKAAFFLPLLLIFVPVLVGGFYFRTAGHILGSLFLYLLVGIAEETYFRGIVVKYLQPHFSRRGVIVLSALIFAVGHLATAFTGGGALEVALTVLNAFIFGVLAIELTLLSGNIVLSITLHFMFDFLTKISAFTGAELLLAELVRGTLMVVAVIWLTIMLVRADVKPAPLTDAQRTRRKKRLIALVSICCSVLLVAVIALTAFSAYGAKQLELIPDMSFRQCLAYTLEGNSDGVITVGIVKDGEVTYTVYGAGGEILPQQAYEYEIGSLTKTFTAALVARAVAENKLNLDDTLDEFFPLPNYNAYPTLTQLLTHTSGYKAYYIEMPMLANRLGGVNDFCGVTDDMVLAKLNSLTVPKENYPFLYCNYGYALLGCVLEKVYSTPYTTLLNNYAAELGLTSTHLSLSTLPNAWQWQQNDAYLAAGGLTSNITDMLRYAQLQLSQDDVFSQCHDVVKRVDASTKSNKLMQINMDSVGLAWLTDESNGIVWHNGGTGNYNCYLGFLPHRDIAVVVLSNLAPDYRIPATVLGVKLLLEQ